ncbi:hypothetical protein Tco_0605365, partial [Tanacetum coccineum]
AIQADCDIKAINIILQGLPIEIYALVSQPSVAKDLWRRLNCLCKEVLTHSKNESVKYTKNLIRGTLSYLLWVLQVLTLQEASERQHSEQRKVLFADNCKRGRSHVQTVHQTKEKKGMIRSLRKAQAHGQILNEEEQAFLADPDIPEGQGTQTVITHNAAYQADDLMQNDYCIVMNSTLPSCSHERIYLI